jgi:polyisoprenoid-binding protein YceI
MRTVFRVVLGGTLLILGQAVAQAEIKTFRTAPRDTRNLVQFISDAPMEKVVGKTHDVTGTLDLNLAEVAATTSGTFEVDLRTLDTGIGLRNKHMRKDHLETDKFPKATFTLQRFVSADRPTLGPGETANVVAEGELALHGVTKVYQVPVRLTYEQSGQVTVSAAFVVKLADHQIRRPELLFMRLAEEQNVEVSFSMTDLAP